MLQPPNTTNASTYVPPADPIAPLRAALRGHYDIEREIGQGAFATVYLARDLKHDRKVAVKVLNADPTSDIGELRFIREIRTLARLQHPNILPLHDSGHVEALLYYVMPYVSGDTVRDRIDREKQMSVETACSIARDIADALAYAHAQGIIHRDIKPENILLSTGHPILADFGIARAIDLAGVRQLTRTGAASPGTPAYMSPEQLLGDKELDGRSDTYSLGCVLFEMVTGKPPFAGKEGFVKRFTEPPPRASTLRKGLPVWLDEAIAKALQRERRDRYPTAKEFVEALCGSGAEIHSSSRAAAAVGQSAEGAAAAVGTRSGSIADGPSGRIFPSLLSNRRVVGALAVAFAATVLIAGVFRARDRLVGVLGSGTVLNTKRIVVFPLRGDRSAGEQMGKALSDALRNWKGIEVVSDLELADVEPLNQGVPSSLKDAKKIARKLGAGSLIWGEVAGAGNSAHAKFEMYDVAGAVSGPRRSANLANAGSSSEAYSSAAVSLLRDPARPPAADGGDRGTQSFNAWVAYGAGHASLAEWDLVGAEREFRSAVTNDPDFNAAQTWLAQVLSWTKPENREWQDLARKAAADSERLSPRDRLVAAALAAMADGRYPDACIAYERILTLAQQDFVGQYGLGECRSRDTAVLPDRASPSRWRFRGSAHSALVAYMKALRIQPGAHVLFTGPRLERLLPIGSTVVRSGTSLTQPLQIFAAYPTLNADTVEYVPYPLPAFGILPYNPKTDAALRRNIETRVAFASDWVQQYPTSANAQEALADALEARGDLADDRGRSNIILRALDSAARFSADPEQKMRLAASAVRVRLKRGEFEASRRLADSLFRSTPVDSISASQLHWVAALMGRAQLAGTMLRSTYVGRSQSGILIPPAVATAASKYFVYAALGICGSELSSAEQGVMTALENGVAIDVRSKLRGELTDRARSLAAPCSRAASTLRIENPTGRLQIAQRAFAQGDFRRARVILGASRINAEKPRPSDTSLEYLYQGAWLRLQLGDTATAAAELDGELAALPTFSAAAFQETGGVASIGRAMALRAELAAKQGDVASSKHWATAITTLWKTADPSLLRTADHAAEMAGLRQH